MKGAKVVVKTLIQEKVDTLFAYIGGAVIPIFDELFDEGKRLRIIRPHHEQAGVHAADGYARSTGKVGTVLVTSGPGATNTVTGIATAFMDSVPLVVITGQIPSTHIGTDAFQEADITGITLPITKANFLVRDPDELAATLKRAFAIARSGRPGPVLVDIPSDIQRAQCAYALPDRKENEAPESEPGIDPEVSRQLWKTLKKAGRPLLLVGGGTMYSEASAMINDFLDQFHVPVVHTLMGHGLNPADDDFYLGGIGMHGTPWGNYALQHADFIIALGTRFSDRILGNPMAFAPKAAIVQVDIDPSELGKVRSVDLAIHARVSTVIRALLQAGPTGRKYAEWMGELAQIRRRYHRQRKENSGALKPQHLLECLRRHFPEETIVTADVGQNQMWVAQHFRFRQPRCFLTSGGLGTMGYSLPAAIGAKVGHPDRPVLMVSGDGGFQMNIQELATVVKNDLELKMVILDNGYLGMVRQWQELLCQKRYSGTSMKGNPDFSRIANAYGIASLSITRPEEAEEAAIALAGASGSFLLHAHIDPHENVLPMVPPGKPLSQMIMSIQ